MHELLPHSYVENELIKLQQNIVLPLTLCVFSMLVQLEIFKLTFPDKKNSIHFILSLSFSSL